MAGPVPIAVPVPDLSQPIHLSYSHDNIHDSASENNTTTTATSSATSTSASPDFQATVLGGQDKLGETDNIIPLISQTTMPPSTNPAHTHLSSASDSRTSQSLPTVPASPSLRLQSIQAHVMANPSTTSFPADTVPQAPEDALFGLMAAYRADTNENKVDLGIGAYRDDNAKPWVLPVVKKVIVILLAKFFPPC